MEGLLVGKSCSTGLHLPAGEMATNAIVGPIINKKQQAEQLFVTELILSVSQYWSLYI